MNDLELAIKIAWEHLNTAYRWGGDDPIAGFDCSGFVIEILKSVGILPRKGDWTADGLYKLFAHRQCRPQAGALVFWKNESGKMRHVEFCIDSKRTIGASGGGSKTESIEDAIAANAYIKIRPVYKPETATFINPF